MMMMIIIIMATGALQTAVEIPRRVSQQTSFLYGRLSPYGSHPWVFHGNPMAFPWNTKVLHGTVVNANTMDVFEQRLINLLSA